MRYKLVKTSNFMRSAKKLAKKYPDFPGELRETLAILIENPFDIKLKTHKLKGELNNYYSCSINYTLRIIYKFVQAIDSDTGNPVDAIILSTIGTHDEVY